VPVRLLTRARVAAVLWALLLLFVVRVLGQLLIAVGLGDFLPPWEEWFSGFVPYPWLLASQIVIILACGMVCLDFSRGRGFFVRPSHALGSGLVAFGAVYLLVMVIRYTIRMSLYPLERWSGGAIPIFFHWVLASFLLVLGAYHKAATRNPIRPGSSGMRRVLRVAAWALVAAGVLSWVAYQLAPLFLGWVLGSRRAEYAVRIDRGVAMKTSDRVVLRSDVFRPLRTERAPTILVRIPFSKTATNSLFASCVGRFWAERGYTVVIQGTRGRYESGGHYYPLRHERRDGLETLGWLAKQPWFNGRLGMWGGSAFGYTQWVLADQTQPGPDALMVQVCSTDFYRMFHPGGAFSLRSALFWAMRSRGEVDASPDEAALTRGVHGFPLVAADDRAGTPVPFFKDWVTHAERDQYWADIDGRDRPENLGAPIHLMAGWYDPFLPGQLDDFMRIRREARPDVATASRLVIGPWAHAETVHFPGGPTQRNYRLESLAPSLPWFDRHLSRTGQGKDASPPVRIYVMGANVWRGEQEWPPASVRRVAYYLQSGGHANSAAGDGRLAPLESTLREPADVFRYDPASPVPTRGGAMLGPGAGIAAQNDVETRPDVLVYTTPPLDKDTEVTGPIAVKLHVATTAPNTDFTAKLVDVHPDGSAYNVSDGILRRGYIPQLDPPVGSATAIEIELWPTSMVFQGGHRIRLEISSSNFPRFDRNPNTGRTIATETRSIVATQAVHHGIGAPSRLVLLINP
jgi:putative CocE/NonD family hydrolase